MSLQVPSHEMYKYVPSGGGRMGTLVRSDDSPAFESFLFPETPTAAKIMHATRHNSQRSRGGGGAGAFVDPIDLGGG